VTAELLMVPDGIWEEEVDAMILETGLFTALELAEINAEALAAADRYLTSVL
jgi:hypothetical protein